MTLFDVRSILEGCSESYEIFWLNALQQQYDVARLPCALQALLENLIRDDHVLRELGSRNVVYAGPAG
jgi:hypothetical protein